ncbi:hypothetical protein HMPREF0654_09455 [Prevotella disiens DNF00882]|uniref:Uncharacterized protein n=2 Tax=Prevotella disiens TaxID=28130 RepID=A0A096ANX6_9BACT|nr:hypothetical protein HMPREF0654_09455 [Prevotella disiens DNF00882]
MFIKQINNVMNKFSNLVQDSINEEELAKVFGGNGDKSETFAHACDSSACYSCKIFDECKNSCYINILKVYGDEKWDYPDPRCSKAPRNISKKIYV